MGSDKSPAFLDRKRAIAWGLVVMSPDELRQRAADWGYGRDADAFIRHVQSL